MKNIACRIFKEQIDVILCLPEEEQGEAIITILKHAFGIEHSTSKLSTQAQSIVNLLKKTIVVKEFSTNYGGRRPNAGKKPQKTAENFLDTSNGTIVDTSIDTSNGTTKRKISNVSNVSNVDIATPTTHTTPISINNINNNNINNINNNNINNNNINNTGIDNKGGVGEKEEREYTPEEKAANKEKAHQIIQQIAQVAKRQPDQVSITYNNVIVHGLLGKFLKDNFGEETVTRARDWLIDHVAGQNWNADKIIKLMCRWTGKTPFVEINKWADFCEKHKKQNKNQNNS